MAKTSVPRWRKRLGNNRVKQVWQAMLDMGATMPDGDPCTTESIHAAVNKGFTMQQLSNHLAKKPQFHRVGTKRIPENFGSQTYPVALWLADPHAYTPPEEKVDADDSMI